jgi:hexosaminidase
MKNVPEGGFYTQDDVREVVAYAKARFINVVPEIEMPGHSQAAVAAYPELGTDGKQVAVPGVGEGSAILNTSESTVRFYQDVLTEVMELFPSKFIHIGGDEVFKAPWQRNPAIQAQMKALGLKNEDELQSWFIHQMDAFLTKNGRRLIGWDEILEGGLAPGATVMSWRGIEGGISAARAGHDVVMAPTSHTYLDYYQSADRGAEPRAIGGFVPLERVYSFEPVPSELSADQSRHVLGAQAQLWTEYIPNPQHLDYMAYPRLCALAEVTWSPREGKDYGGFVNRLRPHLDRLKALDVNFRPLDAAASPPVAVWKPGELTESFATRTWDVTSEIKSSGPYSVRFQYLGGACRLDIEWCELLQDGEPISRDAHPGRTGTDDLDNVYRLELPSIKPGAKYALRASVRTDGGTDSVGEIRIKKA